MATSGNFYDEVDEGTEECRTDVNGDASPPLKHVCPRRGRSNQTGDGPSTVGDERANLNHTAGSNHGDIEPSLEEQRDKTCTPTTKNKHGQNSYEPKKLETTPDMAISTTKSLPPYSKYVHTYGTSTTRSSGPAGPTSAGEPIQGDHECLTTSAGEPIQGDHECLTSSTPTTLGVLRLEKDLDRNLFACLKKAEERRGMSDCVTAPRAALSLGPPDTTGTLTFHPLQLEEVIRHQPVPFTSQLHQHPTASSMPQTTALPPSYDECMKQDTCTTQSGQGEGMTVGDKPPAYNTSVPICIRTAPTVFCPDYSNYTRFLDELPAQDTVLPRHYRPRQLAERNAAGRRCPCVAEMRDENNDQMLLSLMACLLCWPIGIGAVYYSHMSRRYKQMGNYRKAASYGNSAFTTGMTGVVLGLISLITVYIHKRRYF